MKKLQFPNCSAIKNTYHRQRFERSMGRSIRYLENHCLNLLTKLKIYPNIRLCNQTFEKATKKQASERLQSLLAVHKSLTPRLRCSPSVGMSIRLSLVLPSELVSMR